MAKSKKKKQKVADFQKVKLKVGKAKPVGTNATNTTFKTSSINIGAQFREGDDQPVNKRNLSLRDLIGQLNHYNVNTRHEALEGLADLFRTHADVMHDNLSQWLSKVFLKITDTDPDVRRALLLLIKDCFSSISENAVGPFFKVIMTHICCGLTHITEGVQLDTLDVLGVVLDRYPCLFLPYVMKILEHVIDLVSMQALEETNKSAPTKLKKGISSLVSYHLSSDAESSLWTIKNRTRILEKLYQMIQILQQPNSNKQETNDDDGGGESCTDVHVEKGGPLVIYAYKYSLHPSAVHHVELESVLEMKDRYKDVHVSGASSILLKVFPVILNIWVEYEPNKLSANFNDSYFSQSILPGMKVIVNILDILLNTTKQRKSKHDNKEVNENISTLFKAHGTDIMNHFLAYFVLPIHFSKSNSINSNPGLAQRFAFDFNFLMAKIICSVVTQPPLNELILEAKQRHGYFKSLSSFIFLMIEHNHLIADGNKISELLAVVDTLTKLKHKSDKKEADLVDVNHIFKELLNVYKITSLSSPWKTPVLLFFSKYVIDREYIALVNDNNLTRYMKEFTLSVISNIWSMPSSSEVLIKESFSFMKAVFVRKLSDAEIRASLAESLVEMTKTTGLFTSVEFALQKSIIEMLFQLHELSGVLMKNLAVLCHQENVSVHAKKYMLSVVSYCAHRKENPLKMETYLSFLLSVAIGYSMDSLYKFNVETPNSVSWSILNIFRNKPKQLPIERVITQLEQLEELNHMVPMLISVMGQFLIQLRKLPVSVAFSLVSLVHHFSTLGYDFNSLLSPDLEINQLADLLSAVFLYAFSDTYKKATNCDVTPRHGDEIAMETSLVTSGITLLLCNNLLLRQLIKKWINTMGEYKTNAQCVNSIVEVLIRILQEPSLLPVLREFKPNFQSIVNAFSPVYIPQIEKYLVEQLRTQVVLL